MASLIDILRRGFGAGAFPHQLWFLLEFPGRKLVQPPAKLVDRLALAPTARVLELGPGTGFFSVELARRVPQGRLDLLDLQPEMLERVRVKMERAGLHNVGYTPGDATALPFPGASFDAVFLVAVLGEVPDEAACLREINRVLVPGGVAAIVEQQPDPDFMPYEKLVAATAAAGLVESRRWGGSLGYQLHVTKAG